ncbi:hypothetical protein [Ferrimicrobium sp.]|uniref:NrtR DNA-binding winged helix domain-containing protein n=1 Tax=Ferrimicrobium sp. TaxID=2926050 RepID=UPI0026257BFF|nr:hypothetical protein [Ferrimicrobium sp.]
MNPCHVHPPISIAVVPFLLSHEQPYVLLNRSCARLSLLRVGVGELDVTLTHYAERFLRRTLGLTISPLTQCGADQDLSQHPPAIDICYYGFTTSQFINGDDLIWTPLYHLLPQEDHRNGQADLDEPSRGINDQHDAANGQLSQYDLGLLATALATIRHSLDRRPVIEEIEPAAFTLSYLQHRTEMLLGVRLHTQNFRRKLLDSGYLESIDIAVNQTLGRPALLYRVRKSQR